MTNPTTSTTATTTSTSCPIRKAFIQAQPIRTLRTHSAASLRSSLDGEELGSEKLKALIDKFKHHVEEQDEKDEEQDDNHTSLSLTDDDDDDDDVQDDEAVAKDDEDDGRTKVTTLTTPSKTIATNEQVRYKLLNRLGIQQQSTTSSAQQREANPRQAVASRQGLPSYELPLNDAGDYENWNQRKLIRRSPFSFFSQKSGSTEDSANDDSAVSGREAENERNTQEELATKDNDKQQDDENSAPPPPPPPPKGVHFHATVKAHPIPSHAVYSKRIKQTIWSSAVELEENVARNVYEFEAENWNFDDVVDDEGMIWYHGQWVHPVHFVDAPLSNQRQALSSSEENQSSNGEGA